MAYEPRIDYAALDAGKAAACDIGIIYGFTRFSQLCGDFVDAFRRGFDFGVLDFGAVDIEAFHKHIGVGHDDGKGFAGAERALIHDFAPLAVGLTDVVAAGEHKMVDGVFCKLKSGATYERFDYRRYSPGVDREHPEYAPVVARERGERRGEQHAAFDFEGGFAKFLGQGFGAVSGVSCAREIDNHRGEGRK